MDEYAAPLLILRLWIGVVMLAHGVKHLRGREKTTRWLRSMRFRAPATQWMGMAFGEIITGLLMGLGALTSYAAAGTAAIMAVAYLTVHRSSGFWVTARPEEGWEYVATILVAAITISMLGPGVWSVDDRLEIAGRLDGVWGLLVVSGGILVGMGYVALFRQPNSAARQ